MTRSLPTVLGVDLGGTNVRAGRVKQGVLAHAGMGLRDTGDCQSVLDDIRNTIAKVMTPEVEAIGIGVPSLVDPVEGIVYSPSNIPSWKEVHLKQFLEGEFHVPVHVNNDANCFTLGEFHHGLGRGSQYMIGLIIGTGLGAGIIAQGKLFTGAHHGAGEIGILPFRGDIMEHWVSGPRFLRLNGADGQTLLGRAEAGDSVALKAFADFGADLGEAVKTLLYTYDPDTIILGGSVSKAFSCFEPSLRASLSNFPFPHVLSSLRILPTEDAHMPVLGAAALCLDAATPALR
jgi:glucokinase